MKDKIKEFRDKNPVLDFLAAFIPGVGEAQDVQDFAHAAKKKDYGGMAISLFGLAVPGLAGSQISKGLKVLKRPAIKDVAKFGDKPIYKAEHFPDKIKLRKDDVTASHMNDGTPGSETLDANKVADNWFRQAPHGRAVSYESDYSLSTDSYPLTLLKLARWEQQGLGKIVKTESAPELMKLNKLGKKSFEQLQDKLDRVNKLLGTNYKVEIREVPMIGKNGKPTLHPITKKPLTVKAMVVPPISFVKYKSGNKIWLTHSLS